MKKIVTLIFSALFAFGAQAQIVVTDQNGNVVPEGGTVTFYAEETDWGGGFVTVDCDPLPPYIKNAGTASGTLKVKVTRTANSQLTWCGITNSCLPMSSTTETRSCTLAPGTREGLQLHASFTSGTYATYSAVVECTLGSSKQTFNVQFIYSEDAGIHSAQADNNLVKLNGRDLHYNLTGNAASTLNVYATDGRRVAAERIQGSGSFSLDRLPRGIYVYEVVSNGHRAARGKVLVK